MEKNSNHPTPTSKPAEDPIDTMSAAFDEMSQQADEILQATSQSIPLEADVQEAIEQIYVWLKNSSVVMLYDASVEAVMYKLALLKRRIVALMTSLDKTRAELATIRKERGMLAANLLTLHETGLINFSPDLLEKYKAWAKEE